MLETGRSKIGRATIVRVPVGGEVVLFLTVEGDDGGGGGRY